MCLKNLLQCKQNIYRETKGFTLFELLISIAIIFIITAAVVLRYGSFYSTVLLKNQAYQIALDIREAQVFSVSSRIESGESREEYGLYFDTSQPNIYQLFQDIGDGQPVAYNSGEEILDPVVIDSKFEIFRLCVNDCSDDVSNVSISFKRPNFDAIATYVEGSFATQVNDVKIELRSTVDTSAIVAVEVSAAGQISILNE